jgi:hypothetical protein
MYQARDTRFSELPEKILRPQDLARSSRLSRALDAKLASISGELSLAPRLRPLFDRVASRKATGRADDKAFYDALSGGL